MVACTADERERTITEEIVVSALHQDRLDYLMPGLTATHITFALPFVLYARTLDVDANAVHR